MASNAQIQELVQQLPIPDPWDRNVLIANLARDRGRPIGLMPIEASAFADSPCGLWVSTEHNDWICHESGTTDYHIDQIVCHEIGHMVLGHENSPQFSGDDARRSQWCRQVMPEVEPTTVRAIFARTNRSTGDERDAEMFAHMLMVAATERISPRSVMSSAFFH